MRALLCLFVAICVAQVLATDLISALTPVTNSLLAHADTANDLPVTAMTQLTTRDFDVDIVFTWVNGTDPYWHQLRSQVSGGDSAAKDANLELRFREHDELRFALRSIEKNAPWVNHVYIVACCRQKPSWLANSDKVTMIQHDEVFPRQAQLPSFNSFGIECAVENIPQLKENFLLMNDDMMFGAPVEKSDFFDDGGRPRVGFQTNWNKMSKGMPGDEADAYRWAAHNVDNALDTKYLPEERFLILHQAYPMTKSLMRRAHELFADKFDITVRHQMRSKQDIMPHFLAAWIGIYEKNAIRLEDSSTPSNFVVQMSDDLGNNEKQLDTVVSYGPKLICIGDKAGPASQADVDKQYHKFFDRMFGDKSSFEK